MYKVTMPITEFIQKFPDGETAAAYLEKKRWNGKSKCVKCASTNVQNRRRIGWFRCLSCKHDFSVRSGTIFAHSNIQLHKWFYAIYFIMISRKGISSLQMSKNIGVTQKSTWFMLQRIREACSGDITKLQDIVELDETYRIGRVA